MQHSEPVGDFCCIEIRTRSVCFQRLVTGTE